MVAQSGDHEGEELDEAPRGERISCQGRTNRWNEETLVVYRWFSAAGFTEGSLFEVPGVALVTRLVSRVSISVSA